LQYLSFCDHSRNIHVLLRYKDNIYRVLNFSHQFKIRHKFIDNMWLSFNLHVINKIQSLETIYGFTKLNDKTPPHCHPYHWEKIWNPFYEICNCTTKSIQSEIVYPYYFETISIVWKYTIIMDNQNPFYFQ
jgi:hypothetical protein